MATVKQSSYDINTYKRLLGRFAASHPLLLARYSMKVDVENYIGLRISTEKFTHRRIKGADRICGSFTRPSLFDGRPGHGIKRHDGLGKSLGDAINGADPE
jgi:hypothetical protein